MTVAHLSGGQNHWQDNPLVLLHCLRRWNKDWFRREKTLLVPGLEERKIVTFLVSYRLPILFTSLWDQNYALIMLALWSRPPKLAHHYNPGIGLKKVVNPEITSISIQFHIQRSILFQKSLANYFVMTHKKLPPKQCYDLFSNSMVVYHSKKLYVSYWTQMLPTNPLV